MGTTEKNKPNIKKNKQVISEKKNTVPDVGALVCVRTPEGQKTGILQFKGETKFKEGEWFGIELNTPTGKNDGTVQGIRYFECKPKHGLFCRRQHFIMHDEKSKNDIEKKYRLLLRTRILEKSEHDKKMKKILGEKSEMEKQYNLL